MAFEAIAYLPIGFHELLTTLRRSTEVFEIEIIESNTIRPIPTQKLEGRRQAIFEDAAAAATSTTAAMAAAASGPATVGLGRGHWLQTRSCVGRVKLWHLRLVNVQPQDQGLAMQKPGKVSPVAAAVGGILFGNMFLLLVLVAAVVYALLWLVDATWLLWPLFGLYCANVVVGNLGFRVHERGRGWWPAFCKVRRALDYAYLRSLGARGVGIVRACVLVKWLGRAGVCVKWQCSLFSETRHILQVAGVVPRTGPILWQCGRLLPSLAHHPNGAAPRVVPASGCWRCEAQGCPPRHVHTHSE